MEANNKYDKVGFWRRLAALWIDVFVIYSITKLIIELLSLIEFRISFGALFIITGALYSTLMLSARRQTIGKMLMRILITSETDEPIHVKDILLREVFGKWGIGVAMPMMLGLMLVGDKWLPTVFDILIILPVIIVSIIYYSITTRMWYEQLAGLTVQRNLQAGQVKTGFYGLLSAAVLGIGTTSVEYFANGRVPCRMAVFQDFSSIKPYVGFLKKQKTNPVDYVLGLFDKYDVVVLSERAHPEMTQWDFIYDVVRDPRFIKKAGHVFWEIGQVGMQDYLDKFMSTDSLSEAEVHKHAIHLMRNTPLASYWEKYNFCQYFERLYHLNQTLSPENRVQHHFTDVATDWSFIKTNNDFAEAWRKWTTNRDETMAKTIIREMNNLSKTSIHPPKCLVVMNYRHAMDFTDRLPNEGRMNTYEFLKDSFGNKAANVLINTRFYVSVPVVSGVWDAAFEKIGNKPLGFDLQGSPFGACSFDLFPFKVMTLFKNLGAKTSLRYRDVFTGFVFTHPVKDQYLQWGAPGFYDGYEEEYIRRMGCISDEYKEKAQKAIALSKQKAPTSIQKSFEFTVETIIELIFYGLSGIGLITGLLAFVFTRDKNS